MSVLPFLGVAGSRLKMLSAQSHTAPPKNRHVQLRRFIDDVQFLVLERPNIFFTIATLTHQMATKARHQLKASLAEREQTEQSS